MKSTLHPLRLGKVLRAKRHKYPLLARALSHRKSEHRLCSVSTGQRLKAWCISFKRRRRRSYLHHRPEFIHHFAGHSFSSYCPYIGGGCGKAVVDKKQEVIKVSHAPGESHKLGTDLQDRNLRNKPTLKIPTPQDTVGICRLSQQEYNSEVTANC